ncbi:hypothetical protein [Methylocella sp.]|jgi:hypothetical protein|uniref:hypothetical protein n=1 Tax=Methylocella sp. TaxID=1978226 RepID=UPI003C18D6FA
MRANSVESSPTMAGPRREAEEKGEAEVTEPQLSELERAVASAKGSLEVISTLREEFSEWRDEANNEGEKEALDNVVGHIEELGREYEGRLQEAEAQIRLN